MYEHEKDNPKYNDFVDKFRSKKTTDDCYTPPILYDTVSEYVADYYKVDKKNFVRPFYPGGDYEHYPYKDTDIVVDNPPFSILSKIVDFYLEHDIPFFLFCQGKTSSALLNRRGVCAVLCGYSVTFENGALIKIGFLTNMDTCIIRTDPELAERIKKADAEFKKSFTSYRPNYGYPDNVISAARLEKLCKYAEFKVYPEEAYHIRALDSQRKQKKAIYGGGLLISDQAAEHKVAAERKAEQEYDVVLELSERERKIIDNLK